MATSWWGNQDFSKSNLAPMMGDMLGVLKRQANESMTSGADVISDEMSRRGIPGSGIHYNMLGNLLQDTQQKMVDTGTQYTLGLYDRWLDYMKQNQSLAQWEIQAADERSAQNKAQRGAMWSGLGNLAGMAAGGGFSGGGGGGGGSSVSGGGVDWGASTSFNNPWGMGNYVGSSVKGKR